MLGVYVHIPFCKKICNYCDFCKILYNEKYVNNYLDMLDKEIKTRYQGEIVKSIYIGGGTPSSLKIEYLNKLFNSLAIIKLDNNYEYTFECNIEDINIDLIKILKENRVNRISVGVESFDLAIGKILGRNVDNRLVINNIKLLKQFFDNINIDLIYGVTEDINIVKKDIDKFLKLDIPHISCYSLIIEDNTKLKINGYKNINEDIEYEMYKYIRDKLTNNGYIHYEVSNYAKSGYQSIHNRNYWYNGFYYGFGLGAVSYLDNYRISNTKNLRKYINGEYIEDKEYEDIDRQKENDLILGLRLIEGINIKEFNKKYNDDLLNKDIIKELIELGYLEINNDNIRCNRKYIYLQNIILEKIIGSDL